MAKVTKSKNNKTVNAVLKNYIKKQSDDAEKMLAKIYPNSDIHKFVYNGDINGKPAKD